MTLPQDVEKATLELLELPGLQWHTATTYQRRLRDVRRQLRMLSDDFAQSIPSEEKYSDAYFAYNFPRNFMEAMIIGKEVMAHASPISSKKSVSILDIGCAEGAGMLGLHYSLRDSHNLTLSGVDTSARLLKQCRRITDCLFKETDIRVTLRRYDASDGLLPTNEKYDIIILAHSLAEMYPDKIPIRFIHRLFRNIAENGVVIIIEPALKHLSRRLVDLRNDVINDRKLFVLLPCLHEHACPLHTIRKQKEWCHQSVRWHPPDFMRIMNQGLNREISTLKFSYIVISKMDFLKAHEDQYLVISNLLREKGKQKCFLCTQTGRMKLVRLNKNKTEHNRQFGKIRKGDIISVSNATERGGSWYVTPDTKIQIHHSKYV